MKKAIFVGFIVLGGAVGLAAGLGEGIGVSRVIVLSSESVGESPKRNAPGAPNQPIAPASKASASGLRSGA